MKNTITIKGNVYFSGHRVDITDPCYDNDVVCRLTAPIEPGKYEYVIQKQLFNPVKDPLAGFIASLAIINSEAKAACNDETTFRSFFYGVIGVDAGLAGFFEDKPDYSDEEWGEICDYLKAKDYAEANLDNPFKCNGIATSSGYGDGEYIVAQLRTEEGVVVGYRIDFI